MYETPLHKDNLKNSNLKMQKQYQCPFCLSYSNRNKRNSIIKNKIQDEVEWGFEQSGLLESVRAHGRGIGTR